MLGIYEKTLEERQSSEKTILIKADENIEQECSEEK